MSTDERSVDRTTQHVHGHTGVTSCNNGHSHMHPGVSGPPLHLDGNHVHEVSGRTTFDKGHFHFYRARSGPAIPLPGGYHTHMVRVRTSFNEGHDHEILGFLDPVRG